ncbi:MAG: serine/threonine protein kinase [Candidatus Obscuribacterales bacterium]|nr:serine/threonine protein kinase [Candidatus Obscuribacterales bacterium]
MDIEEELQVPLIAESTGSRLEDRYEFLGKIGQGGMGTVFKARHKLLGNLVAIKMLRIEQTSAIATGRFLNEAKAAKRLKHENVVSVSEFGVDSDGTAYAVMDYANGRSLADILDELTALPAARTINIAIQIARGLDHAHENGIVHRDIKPSNLIVDSSKGDDRVLIVDFGIAKIMEHEGNRLTQTGEVFGSPLYLSPEQALGQAIDRRTDIYSLGCVLYECLTGTPPFNADNPMQVAIKHINAVVPGIVPAKDSVLPKGLASLVNRCLSKDPNERYQSATELISALEAVKSGTYVPLTRRIRFFSPTVMAISLASLVLLVALAIGLNRMIVPSGAPATNEGAKTAEADPVQIDALMAQFFPREDVRKLISDYAKLTLYKDQTEAFALFRSGKYFESAYRCLATVQALAEELKRLERLKETAHGKQERGNIEYAMRSVEVIMNESTGLAGESFLRGQHYDQAIAQYEKSVPYFRSLVVDEHWEHPAVHKNYREYIEALRETKQSNKANEVEADYNNLLKTIKALK